MSGSSPTSYSLGAGRQRHVVLARSLAIYLARQLTSMSYPEIAAAMGRNSHSTIVTAARRIERQLEAGGEDATVTVPSAEAVADRRNGHPRRMTPANSHSLALHELIDRLRYAIERA